MDEYKSYVEIEVASSLENLTDLKKDSEALTWEHSVEAANMLNIAVGSDEFIEIYKELNENYQENMDYLKFFMLTSMLLTKKLLETGLITIPVNMDEDPTTSDLANKIRQITETLMASYLWLTAGKEVLWPSNDDLPDKMSVNYLFELNNIDLGEEY